MDLKQLTYFQAVVEHSSFRKAADMLNVSQPALSISIKRLESTLGCRLLDRVPGRVVPTAFGLSLCQSTRRIQQEFKLAHDRLDEIHGLARGRVSIGVSPYAFTATFAELIADFTKEFPGLEFHVNVETYESALSLLQKDQLDLCIVEVIDRPHLQHTAHAVLYRNPFVIVARPGHPLAKRKQLCSADLIDYAWIYGGDMVTHVNNWRATFEDAGVVPPTPVVVGGDARFHDKLLESTDYLAALPLTSIQDNISAGTVVELSIPGHEWFNYMDIVYREDISMSPGVKQLFDRLLLCLGRDGTPTRPKISTKRSNVRAVRRKRRT